MPTWLQERARATWLGGAHGAHARRHAHDIATPDMQRCGGCKRHASCSQRRPTWRLIQTAWTHAICASKNACATCCVQSPWHTLRGAGVGAKYARCEIVCATSKCACWRASHSLWSHGGRAARDVRSVRGRTCCAARVSRPVDTQSLGGGCRWLRCWCTLPHLARMALALDPRWRTRIHPKLRGCAKQTLRVSAETTSANALWRR